MSSECPSPPRLVALHKWETFPGYGFNLHAEKARPGQFIGKIDPGSPSEMAGLREGDRIVEVNGVNVGLENHQQVVGRIKNSGNSCRLLVVDKECDTWHKEHGVVIRSSLPYTVVTTSNDTLETHTLEQQEEKLDLRLQVPSVEDEDDEEEQEVEEVTQRAEEEDGSVDSAVSLSRQQSSSHSETSMDSGRLSSSGDADKSGVHPPDCPEEARERRQEQGKEAGLDLNMSAKEMRARIGDKKKRDPRVDGDRLDWWQRHHIVQTL